MPHRIVSTIDGRRGSFLVIGGLAYLGGVYYWLE